MSHITQSRMKMRHLDAAEEALRACGLELHRDQKTYATWDGMMPCLHAAKVPGTKPRAGSGGPWEIGLVAAEDGDGFDVRMDVFSSAGAQLVGLVGNDCNRLRREYSAAVLTRKAKKQLAPQGFVTTRENLENGRIRLRMVKR